MTSRIQNRIRSSEDNINVDRDRLSELPDDIIVRILSCMPTIDAVRTVLLRRFGNLWTFIHTLDFDMAEYVHKFCHRQKGCRRHIRWFYRFVHNVLMRHQNLSIERFHLCIENIDFNSYDKRERADLDILVWSRFELCQQAKEICISDKYCCNSILPNFTSQFLVTLELGFCKFQGEFQFELGFLKKLSLNRVWMTDESFQRFIRGCPSLQELVISNPFMMKQLSLSAPNIDKLSLILTENRRWENRLSLYFPNLKNLYLEIIPRQLDIVDVSSVRNIYIKYFLMKFISSDDLQFLHSIKKLQPSQCKWTRIVLELHDFCESCLLGIYDLMKSLEQLEELIIYTTEDFKVRGDLLRIGLPSPYVKPQLKTITLYGYRESWKSQIQLVKLLLKGAAALDELIIVPMNHRLEKEEELDFVKNVSSFPRASPTTRVIFS
ncbi:F-box/FBD/LRR-repeat protein At5g56420-like [Silene latifolia]|uniref:F-box/FBD/LRR-repeat protein At5g56420-like n=1 Tax=Silene latifolia TaxID=37657 RepID=UPI003D784F6D